MAAVIAWRRRGEFSSRPYEHRLVYLNLAAVGLHQFKEYGWPGGFRGVFTGIFPFAEANSLCRRCARRSS